MRRRLRIDAPLPASGPARVAVIAMLALGGLVAISLPVLIALFLWASFQAR
ncbi:MAG: hypothetical protein HZB56_12025 [Deltaproteobacteria bacterium]|nr:hypothetical protein [Deltaproteobacteria bacterium]